MDATVEPLVLNASYGEGGSALLRTALVMAVLTQRPVRLHHVRGGMRKPGLTAEDLATLRLLGKTSRADLNGDEVGSEEVTFTPRRAPGGLRESLDIFSLDKGGASGNAVVVAEALIPVLARAGVYSEITLGGETHNSNTLSFEPFERVTLEAHRQQGIYAYPRLLSGGFGFGTQGKLALEVEPSVPLGFKWQERGELKRLHAVIATSELPDEVEGRGASQADLLLKENGLSGDIETLRVPSKGPGAYATFYAEFDNGLGSGACAGQRGMRMEAVVKNAFEAFWEWFSTNATMDPFLADQILIPAALAETPTAFTTNRVTRRLTTMVWVIKQFLPIHITVLGSENQPGTVKIER
jgi:RNA 3'-terminal phosphate cyclase (ATP)